MNTIADHLRDHRFGPLFTDLLGWEHATGHIDISTGGQDFEFAAVAHQRGLQVLACVTDRLALMNRGLLREVQKRVAAVVHEHILICYCEQPCKQVWQWVVRQPDGEPLRHRERLFCSYRPPETLVTRLAGLRFMLDADEGMAPAQALERVRGVLEASAAQNEFALHPHDAEQCDTLALKMQQGDLASFHRFVELHLPLARKRSQHLCRWFGLLPEDAAQIAFLGLVKAAHRFRPELGIPFSTYARSSVSQACWRLGPIFAFLIRLPVHRIGPWHRLRRQFERVAAAAGMNGLRDYRAELELRDPELGRQLRDFERATEVRSLSDRRAPEYAHARQLAEDTTGRLDDVLETDRGALIDHALDHLRPRDAQVLRLSYGLDGCPPQSLREIGALLGLSRERVRQIRRGAEQHLRYLICAKYRDLLRPGDGLPDSEQPTSRVAKA